MNARLLNRLLIGLCLLLLGWTALTAIAFVRYKPASTNVERPELAFKGHGGKSEPRESLDSLEDYSSIFEVKTSLLSAISIPTSTPEPNWKVVRLIQTTKFRGKWEAIVEYPENPTSPRARLRQKVVWVGDKLRIALTRPLVVKGRTRTVATTVTVSAIGANSITLTDPEGRTHRKGL